MAETTPTPGGPPTNPTVSYERSDAAFRPIAILMVCVLVFGSLLFGIVLEFFYRYRDYQAEIKKSPYPLAPSPSTALPREPRLEQVDRLAGVDTPNVRDRETANLAILKSYGTTLDKGYIRVPIERAMDQLLQQQTLRSRPEPPADQVRRSGGLVDAGESNSGRLFKGGPK